MQFRQCSYLLFIVTLSWGCSEELLHDLDESQANQVLEALEGAGVAGRKLRVLQGSKPSYSVSVAAADAPAARRVLREGNLPRRRQPGLAEVFAEVGLVPTATQERAMMRQALAGELARTLESVDGVRQARVHVVQPRSDPLRGASDGATDKARASVLLRVGPSVKLSEVDVRKLVAGGIDDMDASAVKVVIVRGQTAPLPKPTRLAQVGPFAVAHASRLPLLLTLAVLLVLSCALALTTLYWLRRARQAPTIAGAAAATAGGGRASSSAALDSSLSLLGQSLRKLPAEQSRASRMRQPPPGAQ